MANTNEIFVFGSNLAGRHGMGAALTAKMYYGAVYGQGEGLQGRSYAIPTKDGRNRANLRDPKQTLSLQEIKGHVDKFIKFANKHPEMTFKVTAVGTGLGGYSHDDIGSMFYSAPINCILPVKWKGIVPSNPDRKWWVS